MLVKKNLFQLIRTRISSSLIKGRLPYHFNTLYDIIDKKSPKSQKQMGEGLKPRGDDDIHALRYSE
jgi:hypothetical protein